MTPRFAPATVWLTLATLTGLLVFVAFNALTRTTKFDSAAVNAPGIAPVATLPDMRIDLNAADCAQLGMLPGLGPMLAERILLDRDEHGPFSSVDELDRVSGVGPAIIERLRPCAFVSSE